MADVPEKQPEELGGILGGIQTNGGQIVQQLGKLIETIGSIFPIGGATSSSATAGAATLPANPLGFLAVTLPDGTAVKLPYYRP